MANKRAAAETRRLWLDWLVAAVLAVIYYTCVKHYALGIYNNSTNAQIFVSASTANYQVDVIQDVWKGRLFSLMLTGGLFDFLVHHGSSGYYEFTAAFGLYQAGWLFLLFALVILSLRHALVINLGIFAGVMYNLLPASGLYFYPWDLPATLYFTLAALLFQRGHLWTLAGLVCTGCFFKETVLICALLFLFAGQWRWWLRVAVFAGTCAVYVLGKKLMTHELHVTVAALSMNDSKHLTDLLHARVMLENLATLATLKGLYVIFANAGTMLAVLCFGWQRRFLPYMAIILGFLAGQLMYGAFMEFRIFMQILPLSMMILAERWSRRARARVPAEVRKKTKLPSEPLVWSERPTAVRLRPVAIALVVIPTVLAMVQLFAILNLEKTSWLTGKHTATPAEIQDLGVLAAWYKSGRVEAVSLAKQAEPKSHAYNELGDAWDWFARRNSETEAKLADAYQMNRAYAPARDHYQAAVDVFGDAFTNSLTANNFAWLLATCPDSGIRNGRQAVSLALMAKSASNYEAPAMYGTLAAAYAETGDYTNAVVNCERALYLAQRSGQTQILEKNLRALKLYQANQPFHDDGEVGTNQPAR